MVTDAEVIVVGGGHNGLIGAAYLARAGIDTLLVERRADVGGCASTVSDLGARFNICHCDHTMIRALPIVDELDLDSHGLHYLEAEAGSVSLFHDGGDPWVLFHETERTLDGLAVTYPTQIAGYRRYLADALPLARLVIDMARTHPSVARMTTTALHRRAVGTKRLLAWSRRSVDDVFADYFDNWRMCMPAISTGPTVWGVAPDQPGTGLAALGYATRHLVKTGRPRGGSGALTDATRASFEAAGGKVRCGSTVASILVERGAVRGVALTDGTTLRADVVIAACDPQRVFVDWLSEVPSGAKRLVERWRNRPVCDGYESKIDAVLSAAPRFASLERLEPLFPGVDLLAPTAIVSPTREQLADAHRLRPEGVVADRPTLLVNAPSVLDPTMRPTPDEHVLSLEVLFTPYGLQGGWPGSSEPQRWLDIWAELAEPGFSDSVVRWRAMTPDRYEEEFSMHRGHTPSYGMSPLRTLVGRTRELSRYRTPVSGLYLSGAGTYPGAGIFGASGRNVAYTVERDLRSSVRRRLTTLRRARPTTGAASDRASSA